MAIQPGLYRHYKGGEYDVIDIAIHSETEEQMVLYRPRYGERALWVRPLAMFEEMLSVGGQQVQRFSFVNDD